MSEDALEIVDPHESEDYFRALTYIAMREIKSPPSTIQEIADEIGVSRSTLERHVTAWTNNGLLKSIRKQIIAPRRVEAILLAQSNLLAAVPDHLERLNKIAKSSKSDHVASQTIQWIWSEMVQPLLDQQVDAGTEEAAYLKQLGEGAKAIDPFAIIEALPIETSSTD